MRTPIVVAAALLMSIGLFSSTDCFAQEQPPLLQAPVPAIQTDAQIEAQQQSSTQPQTITIPPGTKIPVTLATAIRTKSTHRGDTIRAVTAFPVTVGTQLAIPAGTFVEGTIEKLPKWNTAQQLPPQIRFTRIIFSNGYTVNINAEMTQAKLNPPDTSTPDASYAAASIPEDVHATGGPLDLQQAPGLPPLPPLPKSHIGLAIGIAAGVAAVGAVVMILAIHHSGSYDAVVYDVGSQFDIVLEVPVTLDSARVAAAMSSAQ
jgi:hypothetical protein